MRTSSVVVFGVVVLAHANAYAQPEPTATPPAPASDVAPGPAAAPEPAPPGAAPPAAPKKLDEARLTFGGYLEGYYQVHFQDPSNRITNLRGYDDRSRSFTLSNVALDVKGERGAVAGHIIVQIGAYEPNRSSQDTATLGVTAWF